MRALGTFGENFALCHLQEHGLTLLEKNYQQSTGEIDLIMRDRSCIVFVEVKLRSKKDFDLAFESVDRAKQRRIINTAQYYLKSKKLLHEIDCRFDVVAVENQKSPKIEWISHAFSL